MPELTTERLVLRTFTAEDFEAVHAYAADPEVCRHVSWGPNTVEQTRAFLEEMVTAGGQEDRSSFTWAVTVAGAVVGACSVTVSSAEHRRGEMGYALARTAWGHGYATEAAAVVLEFAQTRLGLARVEATCRPGNAASAGVLRKIGMQQEALMRSHLLIRGRREDSLLFAAVS